MGDGQTRPIVMCLTCYDRNRIVSVLGMGIGLCEFCGSEGYVTARMPLRISVSNGADEALTTDQCRAGAD